MCTRIGAAQQFVIHPEAWKGLPYNVHRKIYRYNMRSMPKTRVT